MKRNENNLLHDNIKYLPYNPIYIKFKKHRYFLMLAFRILFMFADKLTMISIRVLSGYRNYFMLLYGFTHLVKMYWILDL